MVKVFSMRLEKEMGRTADFTDGTDKNDFLGIMRNHCALLFVCVGLALNGCATASSTVLSQAFVTPKLDVLNQQIGRNAEDAQAYSNRGYTLALLGRKTEARADLQKAVALKDNGPMHNRVGWAYFNLGDYQQAAHEFEIAAKMSDHRAHYDYYSLVLGYWGTGEVKKALENYQLAVERDPRFGEYKTLNERTAEWTGLERRAIHETYVLWSKTWKP
jgi:tetratricopeptide (TPR) repeat protein